MRVLSLEIQKSFWIHALRFLFRHGGGVLVAFLLLAVFGLLMLYSSVPSLAPSSSLLIPKRQAIYFGVSLCIFLLIYAVPLGFWYRYRLGMLFLGLCVLLFTLVFTPSINGAHRWIFVGPFSFQGSFLGLFTALLFWGAFLDRSSLYLNPWNKEFYLGSSILGLFVLLILLEPDWSIAGVLVLSALGVLVLNRYPWRYLVVILILGAVAVGAALFLLQDYHFERAVALVSSSETHARTADQTLQSLTAVSSGGFFGRGLGQGFQKLGYLPEAYNDFIFAVLSEELGALLGLCVVGLELFLFMFLLWRARVSRLGNLFVSNFISGLLFTLILSLLLHLAVNLGLLPVMGVPLPFFSYGGSAYLYLALVLGVVYRSEYERYRSRKRAYSEALDER